MITGTCRKTGISETLLDVLAALVIPTQIPPGLLWTLTRGSKVTWDNKGVRIASKSEQNREGKLASLHQIIYR